MVALFLAAFQSIWTSDHIVSGNSIIWLLLSVTGIVKAMSRG